jgi:cysteine desulfurase/selenocysteine lyase
MALLDRAPAFEVAAARAQFPVFSNNPGLVFLDTAASAQKPQIVIDALAHTS